MMSDELKPCPHCGNGSLLVIARRAAIYSLPNVEVFEGMVLCEECGGALHVCHTTRADTPDDIGERELRDTLRGRWNARAERTCHPKVGVGGWFCSECGVFVNNDCIADAQRWIAPRYCPNCDAKVVV